MRVKSLLLGLALLCSAASAAAAPADTFQLWYTDSTSGGINTRRVHYQYVRSTVNDHLGGYARVEFGGTYAINYDVNGTPTFALTTASAQARYMTGTGSAYTASVGADAYQGYEWGSFPTTQVTGTWTISSGGVHLQVPQFGYDRTMNWQSSTGCPKAQFDAFGNGPHAASTDNEWACHLWPANNFPIGNVVGAVPCVGWVDNGNDCVYLPDLFELVVSSTPETGVPITIDGVVQETEFTVERAAGIGVTLVAPATFQTKLFAHWAVEDAGGAREVLNQTVTVTMPSSGSAIAYAIYEDAPPFPPEDENCDTYLLTVLSEFPDDQHIIVDGASVVPPITMCLENEGSKDVLLSAPELSWTGTNFIRWLRDGQPYLNDQTVLITVPEAGVIMTAQYGEVLPEEPPTDPTPTPTPTPEPTPGPDPEEPWPPLPDPDWPWNPDPDGPGGPDSPDGPTDPNAPDPDNPGPVPGPDDPNEGDPDRPNVPLPPDPDPDGPGSGSEQLDEFMQGWQARTGFLGDKMNVDELVPSAPKSPGWVIPLPHPSGGWHNQAIPFAPGEFTGNSFQRIVDRLAGLVRTLLSGFFLYLFWMAIARTLEKW